MIVPANVRYLAENSSQAITKPGTDIPCQQTMMTISLGFEALLDLFGMVLKSGQFLDVTLYSVNIIIQC